MKAQILATVASAALLAGCSAAYGEDLDTIGQPDMAVADLPEATGYFAADSTLPFQTPDFSKISEDDYLPAFEQGMAIQQAEIQAIIDNPAPPTMSNTIVALEKSGRMLGRVARVFFAVTGSNTTDRLDEINTEISPKLTAHGDSITLNPELFARVKAVYDNRAAMAMTREDARLLEETYQGMVHAGALLTDDDWQYRRRAIKKGGAFKKNKEGAWVTRRADGACIFLNREDHAGGSGCALHAKALKLGQRPLDWKPDVCWQVPIRLDIHTDDYGHDTVFVRAWERRDWGEGGFDFHWWCSEESHAYSNAEPLYETSRDELVELVGELVQRMTPIADMKDLSLSLLGDAHVPFSGDPVLIQNAVRNLSDNGMKYGPSDSSIEVTVAADPDPTITVCDHGPGFPENEIETLTTRFQRGENARDTIGSGLGLTIAQDVATAHGGRIQLENRPEGGACVILSL